MDWDKYAKEYALKHKDTGSFEKERRKKWKQTIREFSDNNDTNADSKENTDNSTESARSNLDSTSKENTDFTMNAEETKQFYHDLGIDDLLE